MPEVIELPVTKNVITEKTAKSAKPDFGQGRYSALMDEVFEDAKTIFRIQSNQAEKLARQIASDLGAVMASSPVKVKLGKVNDDGKLTISEAAKVKGVTVTNALMALKALSYAGEAGKSGFSWSKTEWQPNEMLSKYLITL